MPCLVKSLVLHQKPLLFELSTKCLPMLYYGLEACSIARDKSLIPMSCIVVLGKYLKRNHKILSMNAC